MKFHLITMCLALVANCGDGETNTNNLNRCTQQIESFESVTSFMKTLYKAYSRANQPFRIYVSDSESFLRNQEIPCLRQMEFGNTENNVTCYTQWVFEGLTVVWTSVKGWLLLSIVEGTDSKERIMHACSYQVKQEPCKTTTASTTCSCNTQCSTLPTTGTETRNIRTTTDRSTSTITTCTETGPPQSQNVEDMCAKSSDIVIAIICSFVGGVVCAVVLLLIFCRRHVCKGTETGKPKDEGIILDDDAINAETFVSKGSKPDPDKKTYETLTSLESTKADKERSDHVYLGLDTRLKDMSDAKHVDENTLPTNSNEISKQTQVKEQSEAAKEDHVYNVLKSEECANVYENAKASDLHDHTYIGLNNRDTKDRNEEQGSSKGPEYNDRTSEYHDYLILADEVKGFPANVTHTANEVQGCELHMTEMTGVDPSSSDHAYFTLQKIEQSCSPTPDVEQNDEDSESENYTDGHAYHTLERV